MPALDINMIESLSRELHPPHTNLMAETEVTTASLHPIKYRYFNDNISQSIH